MRAGVDDREQVAATGINVDRLFVMVSALASFLAGMAGVAGGAFLTLYPGAEWEILVYALVVVIVGGLGSLGGAMIGALIVGLLDAYGRWLLPEFSYFVLFAPMAVLLLVRPRGIAGQGSLMRPHRAALVVVAIAAALVLPYAAGPFWMGLVTQMLIFGLLALSTDLLLGHAGLFSLCHASFFAVSAYTVAILQVRYGVPTALAAPAGILAGTFLAAVFGLSVRTRGVYFILVTLALGYVVWGVAHRWSSFTGGDNGVTNVPFPAVGPLAIGSHTQYYYFVVAVIALCALGYRVLIRSPFGLTLRGIKASESRMRSLGYRTGAHLYVAFVLSGVIASLAGVLYVYYNRFVNPVVRFVPDLGRGGADGDRRRQRHGDRTVPRLRHHPRPAQLGVELLRALRGGARHRLHRHRAVGARRNHGARRADPRAPVRRTQPRRHERRRDPGRRAVEGVRRPARGRRRELRGAAGRAARADRPERRRQDDALPLHHRHAVAERGRGRALRPRHHAARRAAPHRARDEPHVPDLERVRRPRR